MRIGDLMADLLKRGLTMDEVLYSSLLIPNEDKSMSTGEIVNSISAGKFTNDSETYGIIMFHLSEEEIKLRSEMCDMMGIDVIKYNEDEEEGKND
jgi:hypothetical protein